MIDAASRPPDLILIRQQSHYRTQGQQRCWHRSAASGRRNDGTGVIAMAIAEGRFSENDDFLGDHAGPLSLLRVRWTNARL